VIEKAIEQLNEHLRKGQITSATKDADIERDANGNLQYTGKITYTIEVDKNL